MKFLNLFHRVYEEQEIKANAVDVFYFLIDSLHSDPNMKTNWKRHVSLQYYVVNSSFCPNSRNFGQNFTFFANGDK